MKTICNINAFSICVLLLCFFPFTFVLGGQQFSYNYDPPGNLTAVTGTNAIAPSITTQPQPSLLYSNAPVTLSVVASGAGLSYQWYSNGIPILGATADSLVFSNLTGVNTTNFTVIIINSTGTVTSAPAVIWADSNGNGIPDWWELKYFGNLNQTAAGDYDDDGVNNLNEYREGTIPNSASSYNPRLYIQIPTSNGRVVASPDQPYYTMGSVVALNAIPDPGQSFLGWSGAAGGIKTNIAVLMSSHQTVVASFGVPLPVALDNTNLVWTTGGSAPWYGQTPVSEDGVSSAQSGLIASSQQSWLQANVSLTEPAQFSFWWGVSSQSPDALSFSIDGTAMKTLSGEVINWQYNLYPLPAGNHTLLWTYSKGSDDASTGIPFTDAGWVDEVTLTPPATNCVSPPSGLVAWWTGQNNAFDAAGTNNGTLVGGANYAPGEVGQAFNFGGVNGYVNVPNAPALNLTNALTIETWIELNNLNTYYFIADKQPSGAAGSGYSGNFEFRINPSGYMELLHQTATGNNYSIYTATSSISAGAWHHVAATLVSGGNVNFYLDGIPAGTSPQQGIFGITNSQPVRIGTRADGYSYFNGLIDELSIYNRVLSSNEINSIYLAGTDGKCLPVVPPPTFDTTKTGLQWMPSGLQLKLNGLTAQRTMVIYASTDLISWVPILTNVPAATSLQFLDTTATNSQSRFYRAALFP